MDALRQIVADPTLAATGDALKVFVSAGFSPSALYAASTANPVAATAAISAVCALGCWLGQLSGWWSWVDRLWSIVPAVYALVFAVYFPTHERLLLMASLSL